VAEAAALQRGLVHSLLSLAVLQRFKLKVLMVRADDTPELLVTMAGDKLVTFKVELNRFLMWSAIE
jgi:hypothetical protein